ncbi:MAG: TatD family nuclease-associated radical SAM protein [Thermoplasmata archaeon]|nr:TatD family nuclease-associated radical SAM protein [Thermoplasmata archaeon]
MSILYRYGSTWYINMTNRCPCECTFCVRNHTPRLGSADSLWLVEEPTVEQVEAEIRERASDADEIVFCGYGEPTERLDDLLTIARWIRAETDARVRLDTNGLGNLVNGRDIVPELAEVLDSISISLNAPDSGEYMEVCNPVFGEDAYPALRAFIEEAAEAIPDVTLSVVGGSISLDSEDRCRAVAESLGVDFRVR